MSGNRRRTNSSITISLFSFQDIITCLSGIMILLVLLIALDIAAEKSANGISENPLPALNNLNKTPSDKSPSASPEKDEERLKMEIGLLKKKLLNSEQKLSAHNIRQKELKEQLQELKDKKRSLAMQKSVFFIPVKEEQQNQRALLIECSKELIRSGMVNDNSREREIESPTESFSTDQKGIRQLIQSLEKLDKSKEHPLFIIKPSASDYAMQLIWEVHSMGFDVGYDAMVEEESVAFGEKTQ